MDLLNTLSSVMGGGSEQQPNDVVSAVMGLIGGQAGGIQGLVSKFASNGLGDVVNSWVGTGSNLPVSAEQLQNVLGSDTINSIASKLGMDSSTLSGQLSNILPQVVDKLTPGGTIPEGDLMSKGMSLLGGLLGGK